MSAFLQQRRPLVETRAKVDIDHRIDGQRQEACERRAACCGAPGATFERRVTKPTFVRSCDQWSADRQRADLGWHRDDPAPEVPTVQAFLDRIDEDAYACFFG